MSQVTGLPDTKPEGALEITAPLSSVLLEFDAKTWILTFGPGEVLEIDAHDVPEAIARHFGVCAALVGFISDNQLVWADPAMVQAAIEAGI